MKAEAQLQEGLRGKSFERSPAKLFELRIGLAAHHCGSRAALNSRSPAAGRISPSPVKAFQRRLREVAFIPIITPSLVQLKTALDARQQPQPASEIA